MAGVRNIVDRGGPNPDKSYPGDLVLGGESLLGGQLTTVGAGIWTGDEMANGIIYRTGPTAGYTDTTDSAENILASVTGNLPSAEVVPGSTWRLIIVNTVAFALTLAAGARVKLGSGVVNIAASLWREYLVTVLNSQPLVIAQANLTNGSPTVTFVFSGTQTGYAMGPNATRQFTMGASVSGTGVPANTTVAGVITGPGGVTGITLSANATATNTNIAVTVGPLVQIDGLRSGTI